MPLLARRGRETVPGHDRTPDMGGGGAGADTGARTGIEAGTAWGAGPRSGISLTRTCANPSCGSGWLHLTRLRSVPVFERGWSCSADCTGAMVDAALRREREGRLSPAHAPAAGGRGHRIPLGLLMLKRGWITAAQLRRAVAAQRAAGAGRLGAWLIGREGVGEDLVTRALGLQWSCPVLSAEHHDPQAMAGFVPRLFVDAFGALPLRAAAGRLLYLGFEERLDPTLALAVERMTGMRVECGLVEGTAFRAAHARMLQARFPSVELIEASSEPAAAQALARAVEKARPIEARLAGAHDCIWLRMWTRPPAGPYPDPASVSDLICSIGAA